MKFIKDKFKPKISIKDGITEIGRLIGTTKKVTDMYNINPFPNYNNFQSKMDLVVTIDSNIFLKDLKKQIGFRKSFIEVGAGTCQLSIGMAIGTNNEIVALDPTINSLKLGQKFAKDNKINNVNFLKADIFEDPIKENYFDYVWCSGVLHHTSDSKKGFEIISKWVKPGGTIIIGLYNTYGRLRTNFRQIIYKLFGSSKLSRFIVGILDPHLRKNISSEQANSWIVDQYEHPVERSHSLDEVLNWFSNNKIDFVGSLPDCDLEGTYIGLENMNGNKGTFLNRLMAQIGMLFTSYGSEGGLFLVIGKRRL